MRVLILSSEYPPQPGGIANYVRTFSRLLVQAGHQVVVVSPTQGEEGSEYSEAGVRIVRFVPRSRLLSLAPSTGEPDEHMAFPFNVMSYAPALSYQLADEVRRALSTMDWVPDVIECQDYNGIGYFIQQRRLAGETGLPEAPLVVHLHGPRFDINRVSQVPRYAFPEYWVGQMEKFTIVSADGLLSPSRFLRDRVCREIHALPPLEVIPLPCVFAGEHFDHWGEHQPERGEVLCVGRLQVWKGTLNLVKACAGLWERGVSFRLSLLGGDTEYAPRATTVRKWLLSRYARYVDSGHLFLSNGPVPQAELHERMAKAWAVVVPSLWESFSLVCAEAMALGKTLIVSSSGGQVELVGTNGEAGFVFDWRVPGQFEEVVGRVLSLSEAENRQIGAAAAKRIRAMTDPEQVIPDRIHHFEQVIQRTVEKSNRRRVFPVVRAPACAVDAINEPRDKGTAQEEMEGLLSVVVPFYNLGRFLPDAIGSILSSTYRPIEVIIVDDKSTDPSSIGVLEEFERQGIPNVRIIRHATNCGISTTRNTGALAARGEFLAFVDADDMVEPGFFGRGIGILQRYENVSFVYSWLRYFGDSTGCWINWNAEFPYLLGHNMCAVIVVVRKRDWLAFGTNRPEVEYAFEDYDSWIRMVASGCVGVSIPEFLARYRVRKGSMLRGVNRDQALYLYDLISHGSAEVYREHAVELFNLLNANGPGYLWSQPAMEWQPSPAPTVEAFGVAQPVVRPELLIVVNNLWTRLQGIPGWRGRILRKTAKLGYRGVLRLTRIALRQ